MEPFKVIIVEDVPLELKGTEGIFKNEIPEAEIIGTAESETSRLSVRGKLLGGRRGMGFPRYVGRQNGYVYSPDRL